MEEKNRKKLKENKTGKEKGLRIRKRKKKARIEDLPLPRTQIDYLATKLAKQIDEEIFEKKSAHISDILTLAGAGLFLATSFVMPNLPKALKSFFKAKNYEAWKRFNIPYLKRTLKRLEKQKLVEIENKKDTQIVKITDAGRRRILKYSLDKLKIEKPKSWDGKWRLISYDIPEKLKTPRDIFREYLSNWEFYPLHESAFLHAYPCEKEIEFLREYLGIGGYVRIFTITKIENDKLFKDFFGV